MTLQEIAEEIVKEIDIQEIINKVNTWGGFMTEDEKKELFKKGGIL